MLQVQAHGGQLLQWQGRFYWVGEGVKPLCDYSQDPYLVNASAPCYGKDVSQHFNLYSSSDLASWTFEGVLLDQARSTDPLVSHVQPGTYALAAARALLVIVSCSLVECIALAPRSSSK